MYPKTLATPLAEQTCGVCGAHSRLVASHLGVCGRCIRSRPDYALPLARAAHESARRLFDLPENPPQTAGGKRCLQCANKCQIGESERGFCGLREVREGRLRHLAGTPDKGLLHWYRDPLPTNCVADPFCAGHSRRGMHNLAVFYAACTADCLFCQNWHFREINPHSTSCLSAQDLAGEANPHTYCVCYFGGDPACQMPHAMAASRIFATHGVAVCWETNGMANSDLMDRAADLSLATGGCVKFDLKADDENLHRALTGVGNRQTLENFARLASRFDERPKPPPVVASTLLVPGYVDANEVGRIARFVASLNPDIPYVLLGFGPSFLFPDLPRTSVDHAEQAVAAARAAGLRTVHVGNRHLLSREY